LAKGLGLSLCLCLLGGCGGGGVVSGKVSYKGTTLHAGEVLFLAENGQLLRSPIDPEGNYSISKVPAGTVKIGVYPPLQGAPMPTGARGGPGGGPGPGRPIGGLPKEGGPPPEIRENYGKPQGPVDPNLKDFPAKYRDPETSELTFSASGGTQTYPIELK
jgi:hypothetical protein